MSNSGYSSLLWAAVVFAFIAYGYKLFQYHPDQEQFHLNGTISPGFEAVQEAFRRNLLENWERGGGAFAVYYKGEKVVDLWGGYSDKESVRFWREDTMNIAFSTTKAVAAICVGKLVDDGHMSYDALMMKYWPEFGKHGKDNITIRMIMSHRSGLAYLDQLIDLPTGKDHRAMAKLFEEQIPNWPPGTATGYHAITYGWLVDQIVRRVDPHHRSIGVYYKEEIADKHGIEFYLGLPPSLSYRVSRLKAPTTWHFWEEYLHAPGNIDLPHFLYQQVTGGIMTKVFNNVPWIHFGSEITLNNPDLYTVEQAGVLGIGVVRDLALLFEKFRLGEIISQKGIQAMTSDYFKEKDIVTGATAARGQGWIMKEFRRRDKVHKLYGHPGYGGQNVKIDFESELSFAYMSNHLKVGLGDTARTYIRLVEALYDSVNALEGRREQYDIDH